MYFCQNLALQEEEEEKETTDLPVKYNQHYDRKVQFRYAELLTLTFSPNNGVNLRHFIDLPIVARRVMTGFIPNRLRKQDYRDRYHIKPMVNGNINDFQSAI